MIRRQSAQIGPPIHGRRCAPKDYCRRSFPVDDGAPPRQNWNRVISDVDIFVVTRQTPHDDQALDPNHRTRQPVERARTPGHPAADRRIVLEHAEREGGDSRGPRDARAPARHRAQPRRARGRRRAPAARRGRSWAEPPLPSHPVHGRRGRHRESGRDRQGGDRAAGEQGAGAHLPRRAARRRGRGRIQLRLRADRVRSAGGRRPRGEPEVQDRPELRPVQGVLQRRRVDDRPGAQGAAPGRRPAQAAGQRERAPEAGAPRTLRLCRHRRQQRPDAARLRAGRAGGADEHVGAAARGIGHRQGAHRQRDSLQLRAREEAVRQGELRRAARHADRVGAVRLRERGVHRRRSAEEGAVRAGRRRHALPRRDRRRRSCPRRSSCCACSRSASSSGSAATKR